MPGSVKAPSKAQRLQAIKTHPKVYSAEEPSPLCCGISLLLRCGAALQLVLVLEAEALGKQGVTAMHIKKLLGLKLGIKYGRYSSI